MNEFIRRVVNTLLLKKKNEQKTKTTFFPFIFFEISCAGMYHRYQQIQIKLRKSVIM